MSADALPAWMPAGPDAALLLLTEDLLVLDARIAGDETADDDSKMHELLDELWDVADEIEQTRATTAEGLRAKARVVRCVMRQVGAADGPLGGHLEALLIDLLEPPETVGKVGG